MKGAPQSPFVALAHEADVIRENGNRLLIRLCGHSRPMRIFFALLPRVNVRKSAREKAATLACVLGFLGKRDSPLRSR
jgi:hypothetical protein